MDAIMHMPNRVYFPPLNAIDGAALSAMVLRMLAYGLVELGSLFVLDMVLRQRLRFSPTTQLAMVLHAQWRSVLAALVMWLGINVEAPLEHYGRYQMSLRRC